MYHVLVEICCMLCRQQALLYPLRKRAPTDCCRAYPPCRACIRVYLRRVRQRQVFVDSGAADQLDVLVQTANFLLQEELAANFGLGDQVRIGDIYRLTKASRKVFLCWFFQE